MSIYFYQSIDIRTYSNDFLQSVALIRTTFRARHAGKAGMQCQKSKDDSKSIVPEIQKLIHIIVHM